MFFLPHCHVLRRKLHLLLFSSLGLMTKLDIFLVLLNLLRNQLNFWRLSLQTLFLVKRCLLLLVST